MVKFDLNIAVIPGDGIGREIVQEAIKVLNAVSGIRDYKLAYRFADMGGTAFDKATFHMTKDEKKGIDTWDDERKTKLTLPEEALGVMDWAYDSGGAVLFGSVGRPDLPKGLAELALLAMRGRYGVVNNRPLIIDPILAQKSILFRGHVKVPGFEVISPEESLFNGDYGYGTREDGTQFHFTVKPFTRSKLERTVEEAFRKAEKTGKAIMCASKYNVLVSEQMLSDVFEEYANLYQGRVRLNEWTSKGQLIIDNAGMQIASHPERYANTIVVADAMFGEFLQAIMNVVSGLCKPADKEALEQIRTDGLYRSFIRELCGGLYFGKRGQTKEYAYNTMEYDAATIKNLAAIANRVNAQLGLKHIDSIEVMRIPTFGYIAETLDKDSMEKRYPLRHFTLKQGVETLLTNPQLFHTIVADNMIGDIYTDLASAIVGSLGLSPSSAVNAEGFGIYEQIAGSAPDIAGKNIANPIAQIRSAAMMLEDFGDKKGANMIYVAIRKALAVARTPDIIEPGYRQVSTTGMGDLIVEIIRGNLRGN